MVSNILQNGKIIKTKTFFGLFYFYFSKVHNILSKKKKKKEDEGEDKKDKKIGNRNQDHLKNTSVERHCLAT